MIYNHHNSLRRTFGLTILISTIIINEFPFGNTWYASKERVRIMQYKIDKYIPNVIMIIITKL